MSSDSDVSPDNLNDEADRLFGVLKGNEVTWRDRQLFLQSRGYMLRPRLRPGWKPSWISPRKEVTDCEDSVPLPVRCLDCFKRPSLRSSLSCIQPRTHLVDATRMSDGKLVYIKRVKKGDNESGIATYLYQESLRQDPRNHSVPILDLFEDTDDPTVSYMVMPFLSLMDDPPFETVAEVVNFCDQILEVCARLLHDLGEH